MTISNMLIAIAGSTLLAAALIASSLILVIGFGAIAYGIHVHRRGRSRRRVGFGEGDGRTYADLPRKERRRIRKEEKQKDKEAKKAKKLEDKAAKLKGEEVKEAEEAVVEGAKAETPATEEKKKEVVAPVVEEQIPAERTASREGFAARALGKEEGKTQE